MLFWFTKVSSLLCLITDAKLTIWRGENKTNKAKNQTNRKTNPRRREKHWQVLSGIQAICPLPFPLSHFLWCSGIEDHLKVLLWDPMDTPPSCLLSPGPSGTLALAHTQTPPQARARAARGHGARGVSVWFQPWRWLLCLEEFWNFQVAHELSWLLVYLFI